MRRAKDDMTPIAVFFLRKGTGETPDDEAYEAAVQAMVKRLIVEAKKRDLDLAGAMCVALEMCARVVASPHLASGVDHNSDAFAKLAANIGNNISGRVMGILQGKLPGDEARKH